MHHFWRHVELLFIQDHALLCTFERECCSERSCKHIITNFVIIAVYLLDIQNTFNNMLELHFRAQQSVSEASGVHICYCNAVAFQHEHKIKDTEESFLSAKQHRLLFYICLLHDTFWLYWQYPIVILKRIVRVFAVIFLSSLSKTPFMWLTKPTLFETLYRFNVLGIC